MESSGNDQSFWQFSDQLRLQTSNLGHLSIGGGDSIWNDVFLNKRRPDERRNFDIGSVAPMSGGGGGIGAGDKAAGIAEIGKGGGKDQKQGMLYSHFHTDTTTNGNSNSNPFGWKSGFKSSFATNNNFTGGNGYFNKDVSKVVSRKNYNFNDDFNGKSVAGAKKKNSNYNTNIINNNNNGEKATADKKFKTLPASEALPRSEAVGGYIFVCNNDTMPENLRRMLFGLPPRYRDSVRAITPGLPLFLYNYSTHQLHGIFQAASFGGTNIDPSAWEDKKCPGESRFPAQVRALTKKLYVPLEEDAFRPILHHYDGPKFRLELSVPEALALLDKFEESDA